MIRSHPSEQLLTGYATGELPAAPGLVVAAHSETCRVCNARIRQIEEVSGDLLSSLPEEKLAPDALARMLDRIEHAPLEMEPSPEPWTAGIAIPTAVARFGLAHRRWLKPGLWIAHVRVPRAGGWRAYLVGGEANARVPAHTHNGLELISVLQGAYHDDRRHSQGDFAQANRGAQHSQQVTADGPCVCLVATSAPARWRGAAKFIAPLFDL